MPHEEDTASIYTSGERPPSAQHFDASFPIFTQIGRTGAARYSPSIAGDKYGRVFTYSPDSITLDEYDKMRMDAQIRAGLMLIKLPIQQASWNIQGEDDDINAFCKEILTPIWPTFIRQCLLGLDFGYSVFEKIPAVAYGLKVSQNQGKLKSGKTQVYPHALTIERLMGLDPKQLYLLAYRWSGEFAGVRQYSPNTNLIPASKCFLFSNDHEFSEWHGIPRTKPCYPYWVFKQLMYEFTNIRYELWSMPMKKGRYPTGKTERGLDGNGMPMYEYNSDIMLEFLEEMKSNFSIAIPSNRYETGEYQWDVEIMENNTVGADYLGYIDHLNLMILKGLLVPQLALEVAGSGSYGLAEQQFDFFMMNEQSLMDQLSGAINTQLLPQIVKWNFGKNAPIPHHAFTPIHGDIKEGLQQVFFETLGSGQPIPIDEDNYMVPDWAWISENLGVPVKVLTRDEVESLNEATSSLMPQQPMQGGDPNQPQQPVDPATGQPDTSQGSANSGIPGGDEFDQAGAPNAGADLNWFVENEELIFA